MSITTEINEILDGMLPVYDDVMLDNGYKITISPVAAESDFGQLKIDFVQYNIDRTHESYCIDAQIFHTLASNITGDVLGESVVIKAIATAADCEAVCSLLETEIYDKGGRRAYIIVDMDDQNGREIYDTLTQKGFVDIWERPDFTTGHHEIGLMKEIEHKEHASNVSATLLWETQTEVEEGAATTGVSVLAEQFGVFLRDIAGVARGMILGEIHKESAIPHAYVETFFIDTSLQNKGFGTKLMKCFESYMKNVEINTVRLGTNDIQAPGFYKKIGYEAIATTPKCEKHKDGRYSSRYEFVKKL